MKKLLAIMLTLCFVLPLFACTKAPVTEPAPEAEPAPVDPNAGKLVLAENETSDYRIVYPDGNIEYKKIADILQSYLRRISGAVIETYPDTEAQSEFEILLGSTNRSADDIDVSDIGEEGFVIHQADKTLCITSSGVHGTLYGVYEFLESYLGCYLLTEESSIIPKQTTIALDPITEDRQTPGFEWRRHSHTWVDPLLSRTNCSWGGAENGYIGDPYTYANNQVCHTFGPLLNWSASQSYHTQPCLTDETVYQTMLENARLWMKKNPNAEIISITQNDGAPQDTGECLCENCVASNEKYGSSGTLLRFVNRMAAELAADYPDLKIETLAYFHTEEVPKGGVVPADNVMIRFCTMAGCFMHSLTGEDRTETGLYSGKTNEHYENLLAWSKITKNIYIWEYDIDFGSIFTSIPNFDRLYENIHFYHEIGVKGVFIQGMGETGEFDHLRAYLSTKLLWNPDISYEEYRALMTDFLNAYYGAGGEDILAAITYLEELLDDLHPSMYYDVTRIYPRTKLEDGTFDHSHADKLLEYFESAYSKVSTNREKKRIERTMVCFLYYKSVLIAGDYANQNAELDDLVTINERIWDIIQRTGLTHYKEGFTIPKDPNLKNTLYYWGLGGEGIFNSTTENAYLKSQNQ